MYSDVSMLDHKKLFRSQLMNLDPSFVSEIALLTKSFASNIEAAGNPESR